MRCIFCVLLFCIVTTVKSQTDDLYQFWNEYDFCQDVSQKWVLELDAGFVSSSTPTDNNIFHNITQVYLRGWAHYYPGERWKVSVFYAHYSNKNVPELNQKKAREFRSAIQTTYSLYKTTAVKINLRGRIEDRHLENEDGYMEAVERFRFQIKALYPLVHSKNKFYFFASDELFFKTKSQVSGPDFFDRNRASAGLGFTISGTIQIEVAYANEIMPRNGTDKLVNAFQVKGIFNNFFTAVAKPFKRKKNPVDEGEGIGL